MSDFLEQIKFLSSEERIKKGFKEAWIGYDAANNIIAQVERLLKMPQKSRMPNLLIVGDTNNGKTSILNRLLRRHPVDDNIDGEAKIIPLIRIQAPSDADEGTFYNLILRELGVPFKPSYRPAVKHIQITTVIPQVGLRAILIDEIHDILAGHKNKQRTFQCVIRQLGSELKIPFIAAGTIEALNAINLDPQLANRFTTIFIPKWKISYSKKTELEDEPFLRLLASFEKTLPLLKQSDLSNIQVAEKLLSMSEGFIGELASILGLAVEAAINSGQEKIDLKLLNEMSWIYPSDRNKVRSKAIL
jgi:GTPase SAR1 family protein